MSAFLQRPPSLLGRVGRAAVAAGTPKARKSPLLSREATPPPNPRPSAAASSSAAPSAAGGPTPPPATSRTTTTTPEEWEARRKRRLVADLREALAAAHRRRAQNAGRAKKAPPLPPLAEATEARLAEGLAALEGLLPGWRVDLAGMPAADLARLALDPADAALRVLTLKALWPSADLRAIAQRRPSVLSDDAPTLRRNASQVRRLLRTAADADALVTAVPLLLSPPLCLSILITVSKWYFARRDPVAVLEADPDLIERAMACDMPLEPVYVREDGSLEGPSLDYWNKRTDWQAYIDTHVYKQPRGKGDVFPSERIVGEDEGGKGDEFFVGQGF